MDTRNLKPIKTALISVFYKDGIDELAKFLHNNGTIIYSSGGTYDYLQSKDIDAIKVEDVTGYPSILGGRVKTLHPKIFGGILGDVTNQQHLNDLEVYEIPTFDLVMVDLYPFEETVAQTNDEASIIEKIDVGGPSMIRGAAKNFKNVVVVSHKNQYEHLLNLLKNQQNSTTLNQRKNLAAEAFAVTHQYEKAIANYFEGTGSNSNDNTVLRYGENPQQQAFYKGNLSSACKQISGKELSYNNLVDVDAALQLAYEFKTNPKAFFAIIKHTNACGAALGSSVFEAFEKALAGDPESAFGGILISSQKIDIQTAAAIDKLFYEVVLAPAYDSEALRVLTKNKKRIVLEINNSYQPTATIEKTILQNIALVQNADVGNVIHWDEKGGAIANEQQKENLLFANLLAKHLKSNAIAIVKNLSLVGKGCGQTSRIDALKQAIEKAKNFNVSLSDAVLASDAFFPFDDCVKIAHAAGIKAFVEPGGSIKDEDTINYCVENNLVLVFTGMRHFKH